MSTAKHTPGPWQAPYKLTALCGIYSHDGTPLAKTEREADARLIAAAPDLLDALAVLVEEKADYMRRNNLGDPEREGATIQARAAIAKATGEAK